MPKNIALFSDGTGNSAAKLFKTNVWRLYDALDLAAPDQLAYYDDGVGTSPFKPYAVLGGAFGIGLKRNVQHIYAFLCRNYEPGDRICAFGFSRGAFTIRVLIGFVHDQGLVRAVTERELWEGIEERWRAYRKKSRARVLGKLRADKSEHGPVARAADPAVKFEFVGLWDTVAAYGMPIDELTRAWDQYVWPLSMSDRVPSSSIAKAFHALSLDDERNTFHPLLWTETGTDANANAKSVHLDDERISQVWFSGVHSNVGGGYPDDALSYVPLRWIMEEASRHLRFRPGELDKVRAMATPFGRSYDSRKGLGGYYRYNPRKVAKLIADDYHHVSIARPKIHAAVFERVRASDDRYAPIVLPPSYAVVQADGSIADANDPATTGLNLLESVSQSRARATLQERVWDIVWARRVVYFVTLASSGFLVLFPLIFKAGLDGVCVSRYFCALSRPIRALGAVLPEIADPWIDAFASHPGWFALGVTVLALLLLASAKLATRIKDEMRLTWIPIVAAPMAEMPAASPPSGFIYWLRTQGWYQTFFLGLTRYVLPGLFAIGIYVGAGVLLSRVEYSIVGGLGIGCAPSAAPQPVASAVSFSFVPSAPCAASGYQLQAGARYRIWIEIDPGSRWSDGGIETDLAGFTAEDQGWILHAAVVLRRWIAKPWFKPIARVGARGNDEYPLDPLVPFAANERKDRLYTEITARRDGELFVFVNDAVALWPWVHTYGNNQGSSTVTIQRVGPPPLPQR